ncbi:hypothetical protein ACET3Z_032287 [Daucus carota]
MSGWSNLKQLPEQLGELKGLQRLDASCTSIEELPDSIVELKKLVYLNLSWCEKLRKLPEQFGNMEGLKTFDAAESAIEQLPDSFSNLLNLVHLNLRKFRDCTNLQDFPDLSMLRDLEQLEVTRNGSNLKVSLEKNHLQLRSDYLSTFRASLPNKEIAEWFDYKNRGGCTLSFDIPPNLGDHFVGVALWVVRKCSYEGWSKLEAFITNETEDTRTAPISIGLNYDREGDVQSSIHCIRADDISIQSGDKIMISYPQAGVNLCGAHILK